MLSDQERREMDIELQKNSVTLVAIKPGCEDHLSVVLCKRENGAFDPYVTWGWNKSSKGFFTGHYCQTLREALDDFDERS